VLHFLWSRLGSQLNKKAFAQAFRVVCERTWNKHLDEATRLIYLAAVDFYRHKKGKGATAIDISNFFYRSKQHIAFEKFWASSMNKLEQGTGTLFEPPGPIRAFISLDDPRLWTPRRQPAQRRGELRLLLSII
jgi:hypothetical protein